MVLLPICAGCICSFVCTGSQGDDEVDDLAYLKSRMKGALDDDQDMQMDVPDSKDPSADQDAGQASLLRVDARANSSTSDGDWCVLHLAIRLGSTDDRIGVHWAKLRGC